MWIPPFLDAARRRLPELFNKYGELDMAGSNRQQSICDQLDEARALAPRLRGIEMLVKAELRRL